MRFLLIVAGLVLFSGCISGIREPDAPDDLIARDSMVVVLRDLVVVESYLQNRYKHVNNYYKVMTLSGKACLKKYNIQPDRFERSYNYYVSRQEELQQIYSEVIDSLTRDVNELSLGTSASRPNDTIRVIP